jgi:hypothetical protein
MVVLTYGSIQVTTGSRSCKIKNTGLPPCAPFSPTLAKTVGHRASHGGGMVFGASWSKQKKCYGVRYLSSSVLAFHLSLLYCTCCFFAFFFAFQVKLTMLKVRTDREYDIFKVQIQNACVFWVTKMWPGRVERWYTRKRSVEVDVCLVALSLAGSHHYQTLNNARCNPLKTTTLAGNKLM